jgi:ATP synthase subunit 8
MAALNISTFHGQVFWLVISFGILYIVFFTIIVPNIYMIFKTRNLFIKKLMLSETDNSMINETKFINVVSIMNFLYSLVTTKVLSKKELLISEYKYGFIEKTLGNNKISDIAVTGIETKNSFKNYNKFLTEFKKNYNTETAELVNFNKPAIKTSTKKRARRKKAK